MSSSSDCSDSDDGKQPSSLMKYWEEIRPSSTDEEVEPLVSPARNQHVEVTSSKGCQQNENDNNKIENSQPENPPPTVPSLSGPHTVNPKEYHTLLVEDANCENRQQNIRNINPLWHPISVPDSSCRSAMYQQWRSEQSRYDSDTDLLAEIDFEPNARTRSEPDSSIHFLNWICSLDFLPFVLIITAISAIIWLFVELLLY